MKAYSAFLNTLAQGQSQHSMEAQNKVKDNSNTFDTAEEDDKGLRLASEPGYREVGNVMIELTTAQDQYQDSIVFAAESLRKSGFKVRMRCNGTDVSTESFSDGIMPGGISLNGANEVNNVMNGVYVPDFKDEDMYRAVSVIRPEDTAPESKDGVLFLVDGNGEIKDYLQGEGYKVASDADTLQALLTA